MRRNLLKHLPTLLASVALATLAAGCGCTPRADPFNINIRLDKSLVDASTGMVKTVEVDIVGFNDTEKMTWDARKASEYWNPATQHRKGEDAYRYGIPLGHQHQQDTLKKDDPIWKKWKERGAMYAYVLIYSPGLPEDRDKLLIPLDHCRWDSSDPVKIVVGANGVYFETPPKPEEKD